MLDDPKMEPSTETPRSDPRTRLLWIALATAIILAVGAGTWTVFSGRKAKAGAGSSTSTSGSEPAQGGLVPALYGEPLPDFSLTDRSGRTVTLADLTGKVWVADFIFTRCPNVCPDLTRKMRDIRRKLDEQDGRDVVTVSITVDPKHDTTKVLAEYADNFHADPSWLD